MALDEYAAAARVFRGLGDENRLRILKMLREGERCACKLLEDLQIGQSTLSHHMRILCDAGIVRGRKEGKWVRYALDPAGMARAEALLARYIGPDGSAKRE